ncbi:MAG: transporter [Planctomycetaceae bacterium]|nr:MAG: transporter [Planctomycetaceae bacterium]
MRRVAIVLMIATVVGCSSSPPRRHVAQQQSVRPAAAPADPGTVRLTSAIDLTEDSLPPGEDSTGVESDADPNELIAPDSTSADADSREPAMPEPESLPPPVGTPDPEAGSLAEAAKSDPNETLAFDEVIDSVYRAYPLVAAAIQQRGIAAGDRLAAQGNFDLGLNASTENGTVGFYQTHRNRVGLSQPLYQGGEVFAGYRIGRGFFEPWYKERETNDGGEFRAGFAAPLARNRQIDPRRAELWRANVGVQAANPEIQAEVIAYVRQAGYAYWQWVAAGEKARITDRILELAEDRTEGIRRQVEEGLVDPPVLTDNLRLIAERQAARADAQRRLRQAAIELSLYYRTPEGDPLIPGPGRLPRFPEPPAVQEERMNDDVIEAIRQRPEIAVLTFIQQQLQIDLAQAGNESRPNLDAVVSAAQDVGDPATPLNDKGQFELDAALFFDVPVQRRRARGKILATQARISQVNSRRRLVENQIVAEVQAVYAGLEAAFERVHLTRQALEYAEDLARRERRNYELGSTDLLTVALREQFAVEAAEKAVDALLLYFLAQVDYRAALAADQVP